MSKLSLDIPKISIVTPSLNQGQFLERAILSIINQNYPNLEYIVVDGGSSDNSLEIIKKYEGRLHYWCSEPDKGHYDAINKGFSKATGEIFAWLNSDDMYCPWALKTVGSIFAQATDVNWLTTLNQLIWDKYDQCILVKSMPGYSRDAFLDGCYFSGKNEGLGFIQQESTFWRSSLWNEVGGLRLKYPMASDFDLWSRFYQRTELYGTLSPLGGFRAHGQNRSVVFPGYIEEAEDSLTELRNNLNWHPSRVGKIYQTLSKFFKNSQIASLLIRKAFPKYSGAIVLRDRSEDGNYWKIDHQKFSRTRIP